MYVFRIASDFTVSALKEKGLPTRPIPCALIRTDAKNALSQEFIVLDNRDVYLVCGGFNGAIDFFLIKNSTDVSLEEEPELQYVRHQLIKLPTNRKLQDYTKYSQKLTSNISTSTNYIYSASNGFRL